MRRSYLLILIGLGVVVFLFVSALLARAFSVDSAEQSAITALVQDEARGNAAAMIAMINGLRPELVLPGAGAANAQALTAPGQRVDDRLQASTGFSLGSTLGTARVAWRIVTGLPVVQCVRVRRAGNVFSGLTIELLEISRRINSATDCPAHY